MFYLNFNSSFSGVSATSIHKAQLVLIRLRRLELIAIYVIEASVPMIILFCVILEDVDDLYKWQTFRPSSLHRNLALMKATWPERLPFI